MTIPTPGDGEIIPGICDYARRCLAEDEREFAEAFAARDLERAGEAADAAMRLAEALKRQEAVR